MRSTAPRSNGLAETAVLWLFGIVIVIGGFAASYELGWQRAMRDANEATRRSIERGGPFHSCDGQPIHLKDGEVRRFSLHTDGTAFGTWYEDGCGDNELFPPEDHRRHPNRFPKMEMQQ